MAEFASNWAALTWALLADSAPYLLFGFLFAGAIHVLLPVQRAARRLGHGTGGVLRASLLGIPLPLCSCSVIPVASEIRRSGAGRGAFVSFLISTPETGVDSIAISYALLGPVFAVVRPVAALFSAVVAGILTNTWAGERQTDDDPAEAGDGDGDDGDATCPDSCGCHAEAPLSRRGRAAEALHYGLIEMFVDLSPWLVAGFFLAGVVSAAIPDEFFAQYVGTGLPAMLAMLVVGLPLYVCATASTPIAAAMIAQGLSPGAALVFLLVGPATNIATMLVVVKEAGRAALAIYLGTIAVVAVAFGFALDRATSWLPVSPEVYEGGATEQGGAFVFVMAVVLLGLIANGLWLRIRRRYGTGAGAA